MHKNIIIYTILGTLFPILFGELIAVFIANNSIFLTFWQVITIYYIITAFIFSLFIFRIPSLIVVGIFFLFGVIMETFVFKNIHGFADFIGILFFGNQYIALFGIPYLITKKIDDR